MYTFFSKVSPKEFLVINKLDKWCNIVISFVLKSWKFPRFLDTFLSSNASNDNVMAPVNIIVGYSHWPLHGENGNSCNTIIGGSYLLTNYCYATDPLQGNILQYSNKALFFIFRAMRLRDAQSSSWSLLNLHSPGNVMATFCVVAMWLTLIVVINIKQL